MWLMEAKETPEKGKHLEFCNINNLIIFKAMVFVLCMQNIGIMRGKNFPVQWLGSLDSFNF